MAHRIEIETIIDDARAGVMLERMRRMSGGRAVNSLQVVDVYTIDRPLRRAQLEKIAAMLANPVTQRAAIGKPLMPRAFDWAFEIGFLPGVTDNVGHTAREAAADLLGSEFAATQGVYSSRLVFCRGKLSRRRIRALVAGFYNPLIQRLQIKDSRSYRRGGMGVTVPQVKLVDRMEVDQVDLELDDKGLRELSARGIPDKPLAACPERAGRVEGRGPLALDLPSMKVIRDYFRKVLKRRPTDVELESLAQTWSEHCKHTIFAAELDEVKEGVFHHYIARATNEIRRKQGRKDICLSVFKDNSGGIVFDDDYMVTDKVETHNSPSALDPFGGAITGIVGVNRDTIGFGIGAKPLINRYGYCFADPAETRFLYRLPGKKDPLLTPRRIADGVIDGVQVGGNCSGIPTPHGFTCFDPRYRGKPLVFVGTIGLLPRRIRGKRAEQKKALVGDKIVMVGGRVGQDGIHGATFSSEALSSGSPASAVQIGDPITQKKLSDVIVKEARDKGLYNSITDNGAGGLSCSVAEMARECGGCRVDLSAVPLKYPNLSPWKIWVSESQERMTLAVPPKNLNKFVRLMTRRGVEATVIGEFTGDGNCLVEYAGKLVMDVPLKFLHDGLPKKKLRSRYRVKRQPEPRFAAPRYLAKELLGMLDRLNICGKEFIAVQYDHEVQGGSVIKPLQGKGRVLGEAAVVRPLLHSVRGVVLSSALYPGYGDIDPYWMAACAIDAAIRNAVAVGGDVGKMALLDNFCWCSSDDPFRLGQLKRAAQACYDMACVFNTPFISGKDSMYNDFRGYDSAGRSVQVSVPPTLLVSSLGVVADSGKCLSLDAKYPGDRVYLLGETKDELGASEYLAHKAGSRGGRSIGNNVPRVDAKKNLALYRRFERAVAEELPASAISLTLGGLGVALAKMAIAGGLGLEIDLGVVLRARKLKRDDYLLFSESQGRLLVTVPVERAERFERLMRGMSCACLGTVTDRPRLMIQGLAGKTVADVSVADLEEAYKRRFRDY